MMALGRVAKTIDVSLFRRMPPRCRTICGIGLPFALAMLFTLNAAADDTGDTIAAVRIVREFLANPRTITAQEGLVAIRYYNSGFGTRGDARLSYAKQRVPVSGIFPVSKKFLPISTHEMFDSLPQNDSAFKTYAISGDDWRLLRKTGRGTSVPENDALVMMLDELFRSLGKCSPCVVSLSDTVVVGNVEMYPEMVAEGNAAVLQRDDHGLTLRAVVHMQN
jgi:hypothetical protein